MVFKALFSATAFQAMRSCFLRCIRRQGKNAGWIERENSRRCAIPKSANVDRQGENFDVFGRVLSTEEMVQIGGIEKQYRFIDWDVAAFWEDE